MTLLTNAAKLVALATGAAACLPLAAEEPARLPLKEIEVEGVVVRVDVDTVVIRSDDGKDYVANVNPRRAFNHPKLRELPAPEVAVVGPGSPQQIRPGVFVAYEMELDSRGQPRHVVPSLDILTGVDESRLGFFRRAERGGYRNERTPPQKLGEGKYRIVGQVTQVQGNTIYVAVPNARTLAKIAERPHIEQHVADHRFAQPGDRAVLHGVSAELPLVFATRLRVKRMERPQAAPPLRDGGLAAVPRGERPNAKEPGEGEPGVVIPELPPIDAGGESGLAPPTKFGLNNDEKDDEGGDEPRPRKPGVRAVRIN